MQRLVCRACHTHPLLQLHQDTAASWQAAIKHAARSHRQPPFRVPTGSVGTWGSLNSKSRPHSLCLLPSTAGSTHLRAPQALHAPTDQQQLRQEPGDVAIERVPPRGSRDHDWLQGWGSLRVGRGQRLTTWHAFGTPLQQVQMMVQQPPPLLTSDLHQIRSPTVSIGGGVGERQWQSSSSLSDMQGREVGLADHSSRR